MNIYYPCSNPPGWATFHKNQTMDTTRTSISKSTPLEKIRLAEAEVSRQIAAARQAAEEIVADAHRQAATLKEDALDAGHLAGQKAAQEHLAQIQTEASRMIAQAQVQTEASSQHGVEHIDAAVKYAVLFVIGLPEEGEEK